MVSEGSWRVATPEDFPADYPRPTHCHWQTPVARDSRTFQHIASCTAEIAPDGGNESHLRQLSLTSP